MQTFKSLVVTETSEGNFERHIIQKSFDDLPKNDTLIRVHFAGLNYKDALSATGNKGVSKKYPFTPGVDAAGKVVRSSNPSFEPGQSVLVTGYDLGMNTSGAFAEYICVPSAWVVALPKNLSLAQSMICGTAGFTAALALHKMETNGQTPSMGNILVTGATGGVGSMAVLLFSQSGYEVTASTGKAEAKNYLTNLGASEILERSHANDPSERLALKPRWAGALDTVGGNTLATAIKACRPHGNVAATGLVDTPMLAINVMPFIIRGVNLLGVDSAETPMGLRLKIWDRINLFAQNADFKLKLEAMAQYVSLEELDSMYINRILEGKTQGRIVVRL